MNIRVRLVLLVTIALFITALVMVPRIIEAKRSSAAVVENNATTPVNPVQGRKPGGSLRRLGAQRHVPSDPRNEADIAAGFRSEA